METIDSQIENILKRARDKSQIIGHFQYGHNLLQSSVQIDEIFSMLNTIIDEVLDVIGDVIPDINLAPYKDGFVDSTRANLCWLQLKDNYYGLILNTHKGMKYREFDIEDIQNLLLDGQTSSWYLISKIQNLSYLIASDTSDDKENITIYFKNLIKDIIERFLAEHENSSVYHPAGRISADDLDSLFAKIQIQNTRNIVPAPPIDSASPSGAWSSSIIKTTNGEICWQYVSNFKLRLMDRQEADRIMTSKYLNNRSDVDVFLQDKFKKFNDSQLSINEYCFLSYDKFTIPYVNLNYVVETQLRGYLEVEYTNGNIEKIYPDTQPIVIYKGKNDIAIATIVKFDNDMNKKIKRIIFETDNKTLPHLFLMCSFTGISDEA